MIAVKRKRKRKLNQFNRVIQVLLLLGSAFLGYKFPALMPAVDRVQDVIITGYDGDTAPERGMNETEAETF